MINRLSILLLLPMFLLGQYRDIPDVVTKVATSAGGFLKLETSARAIGMGGSFVASGRGVSGIPYNPSSIAYIEKSEAYFSQVSYLAGITHGVLTRCFGHGKIQIVWQWTVPLCLVFYFLFFLNCLTPMLLVI